MARLGTALVVVATLLVGCPARAVRLRDVSGTTDDPAAERAFRAAQSLVEQQRWAEAKAAIELFLTSFPADPLVADATLLQGRVALAQEQVPRARELFGRLREGPDPNLAEQARFFDGLALARAGEHRAALQVLRPFAGRMVDTGEAALLYRTLADSALAVSDRVEGLRWLDALERVASSEQARAEATTRCQDLAVGPLTADEIERAIRTLPREGVAWPLVVVRRARDALDAGDFALADRMLALLTDAAGSGDPRVRSLADTIADRRNVDLRAIGAILPLSGRAREVGAEVLRGLLVASESLQEGIPEARRFRLVVRDDGGDPARAEAAVDDLVQTEHVVAILGPVEGATAEAAARRAQILGVPIVLLSPREGVTAIGTNVFRSYVTNAAEAALLVREALAARGLHDVALVRGDIPYGQALRTAIEAEARDAGVRIVGEAIYPEGTRSFSEIVAPLRATGAHAILLPCPASDVRLIAPALAAQGLWSAAVGGDSRGAPSGSRPVQLVLTSVAIDPETLRVAGRYLEGALVSTAWVPDVVGPFGSAYQTRFSRAPTVHAAFAHDAFQLVRTRVEAGANGRASLRAALAQSRDVTGATAMRGFGPDREPLAPVRLMRVRQGALVAP